MIPSTSFDLAGHELTLIARRWQAPDDATWVAVLCHGYGEHVGRYEHVAEALAGAGAAVYGLDHRGHGRSEGERVLIEDYEVVVDELDRLVTVAHGDHPDLPVVLVGHSMGGLIGARYAQQHGDRLACLVLSGPVLGSWQAATDLLALDPIPEVPIDPDTLSRDPDVGRAYADDPLVWHGAFKRPTLEALATALDTIAGGGRLAVPALHLHGAEDQLVPLDAARAGWEQIKGDVAEQTIYPGARHEIFNETNRDDVLADLIAFVDRHR